MTEAKEKEAEEDSGRDGMVARAKDKFLVSQLFLSSCGFQWLLSGRRSCHPQLFIAYRKQPHDVSC